MTTVRDLVTWDGQTAAALAVACGVPRLELYDEVASTLDVAHTLGAADAPAGTLVLANAQRAGRGRMGRSWSSAPDRGVWCTIVERPADARVLDVLSIRVGIEVARRLEPLAGRRIGVKWPNDLVLDGGKLGGILVEARWTGARLAWVAIGVGVNVVAPDDVDGAAGMPRGTTRLAALTAIVAGVRDAASRDGQLQQAELIAFAERDILSGRELALPARGVAAGIAGDGALALRTAQGIEHHRAGTVQFAE